MSEVIREVSMLCDVCGNDQFESLDGYDDSVDEVPDYARYKCSDCGKTFTKEELIALNQEKINLNIDDMVKDVMKDFEKKLKKMFK